MISSTLIIRTTGMDPWCNLSVEEYLLDRVKKNQCILYLWQNQNTVVIGRHQNAWKECRTDILERENGKLARRLSGGGAVFHDTGNLNFTFLMPREDYDLERQVKTILSGVRSLGIDACMQGRNDLLADGRKFSGNAFCLRKDSAYHHGTILVSADMEKMTRYLSVSTDKIKSKGIDSVRSRVVNLSELKPGLSIDDVAEALVKAFIESYRGGTDVLYGTEWMDRAALSEYYDKYSSWQWIYGTSPDFDIELSSRFSWGSIQFLLKLEKGMIKSAVVYSDAMDEEFIGMLPDALEGCSFKSSEISKALVSVDGGEARNIMLQDIAVWIEEKGF